ncbi:MAG TPA: ABC transporter substrate-binding protein [Candidatus Omnitrophota bacterium]|nr:ABC transporter substrate-binding protein [Candidatus Omnitrophota bacterium]
MIDTLKKFIWIAAAGWLILGVSGCGAASSQKSTAQVRAGHFPNITHAQALIGHATHRFEEALAPDAIVEWKVFNAGPSAIEALFAGQIDIVYIGPSPAVNGYVKSGGEAARVIAGAAEGGAALVVREDAGIKGPEDLHGKKIASPQLGNTQDVALRSWLLKNKLELKEKGGDVQVLPISNADQQTLLIKKEIDAAWTVEPWVSILGQTAGTKVLLEESSLWPGGRYATTVLLVRTRFLKDHPGLVKKFLDIHVEITEWIGQNPSEAKKIVSEEIERETHKPIPPGILEKAWSRIRFTHELPIFSVREQAKAAQEVGYLKELPDLAGLFSASVLEEVLKERESRA